MFHKNIKTVAGCLSRVTCVITAPEGVDKTLTAFLVYEGESRPATLESAGVIIFPAVPYGHYAYEIRCGGKPVAFGHLLARPSAFPHSEGVVDYTLEADLSATEAAQIELTLTPGPRGPQGEQGEQGQPGEPGKPLTYADLTPEQRAELVAPLEYVEAEQSARTSVGTQSMAFRWAQVCLTHEPGLEGELSRISIPCRTSASTEMTTEPRYLTLWEEQEDGSWVRLADSANAVAQAVGVMSVWEFAAGVQMTPGRKLRVGLLSTPGQAWTAVTASVMGAMGAENRADGCYVVNTSGANQAYMVDMTFEVERKVPRFAPADHATDTTAHVTPEERAAWNAAAAGGGVQPEQVASIVGSQFKLAVGSTVQQGSADTDSIALGGRAEGRGIAVGCEAFAEHSTDAIAIGYTAKGYGSKGVSIGADSFCSGEMAIAIGHRADAAWKYGVAIGTNAKANKDGSIALGAGCDAKGLRSSAIGYNNTAAGDFCFCVGPGAQVNKENSFAIGKDAVASAYNCGVLGEEATSYSDCTLLLGAKHRGGDVAVTLELMANDLESVAAGSHEGGLKGDTVAFKGGALRFSLIDKLAGKRLCATVTMAQLFELLCRTAGGTQLEFGAGGYYYY